jgi:hypothetical protein
VFCKPEENYSNAFGISLPIQTAVQCLTKAALCSYQDLPTWLSIPAGVMLRLVDAQTRQRDLFVPSSISNKPGDECDDA